MGVGSMPSLNLALMKPRAVVAALLCLNLACWGIAHFASVNALLNLFLALAFVDMYIGNSPNHKCCVVYMYGLRSAC